MCQVDDDDDDGDYIYISILFFLLRYIMCVK